MSYQCATNCGDGVSQRVYALRMFCEFWRSHTLTEMKALTAPVTAMRNSGSNKATNISIKFFQTTLLKSIWCMLTHSQSAIMALPFNIAMLRSTLDIQNMDKWIYLLLEFPAIRVIRMHFACQNIFILFLVAFGWIYVWTMHSHPPNLCTTFISNMLDFQAKYAHPIYPFSNNNVKRIFLSYFIPKKEFNVSSQSVQQKTSICHKNTPFAHLKPRCTKIQWLFFTVSLRKSKNDLCEIRMFCDLRV